MDQSNRGPIDRDPFVPNFFAVGEGGWFSGGEVGSDVIVFADSNTPPISFDYFECSPLCLVMGCVLQFG